MKTVYIQADEEGRVLSLTEEDYGLARYRPVEVDDDFDVMTIDDYRLIDGSLSYTGEGTAAREEAEKQAQREALKSSQLAIAATMYVNAANLPRMQAVSVCMLYDEWSGKGVKYTKGQYLRYGDDFAYVEQDHISQPDWTPEAAPSLYTLFKLAPDGIRIWEQPTHAENAFDETEKCHYPDADGEVWISKIDGNTTVPGSDDRYWRLRDADTE